MKKILIFLIIIAAGVALFMFTPIGKLTWEKLTMLGAAIAGPFKFIAGFFKNKEDEIREMHKAIRLRESEFQTELESKIGEREQRVTLLNKEIELLDARIGNLKTKRELVDAEVENMSLQQLQGAGRRFFGS